MSFSSDNAAITNQLPNTINLPDLDNKELFVERLEAILKEITDSVNQKDGGLYTKDETASSQQYYNPDDPQEFRNVYRKVFDLIDLNGANVGASASLSYPHEMVGVSGSAMISANCTDSDGKMFTVVYPDVHINEDDLFFTNPVALELLQCDVVINAIKQAR